MIMSFKSSYPFVRPLGMHVCELNCCHGGVLFWQEIHVLVVNGCHAAVFRPGVCVLELDGIKGIKWI